MSYLIPIGIVLAIALAPWPKVEVDSSETRCSESQRAGPIASRGGRGRQ